MKNIQISLLKRLGNCPLKKFKIKQMVGGKKKKMSGEKGLHNDYIGKRQGNKVNLLISYCQYMRV